MSHEQLKFIFCDLLPDLSGKTVLDIGSRMGPVLYAVSFMLMSCFYLLLQIDVEYPILPTSACTCVPTVK